MIKYNSRLLFIILLVIFIRTICQGNHISINADYMEYDESKKNIYAKGNVKISSGSFVMSGQEMKYDMAKEYVIMTGSVTLKDENICFNGEEIKYDLANSTGVMYECYGVVGDYNFSARKIVKEKDFYYLTKSKISTCELYPPHYFIKVSNSKLIPDKRLGVSNPTLWVGPVPCLYLPYYPFLLKERHDCWWITPGNDDGIMTFRIIYGFPVTKYSYSKIYADFLGKRGTGKGIEYNYRVKDNYKGTLYMYHIEEEVNKTERWNVRAAHWQKLSQTWSLHSNLEYFNDESFSSNYLTEKWDWVKPEFNSSFGLTRQTKKTNLHIYVSRYDVFDSTANRYVLQRYSLPKIDFMLRPMRLKNIPVDLSLTANIGHNYNITRTSSTFIESETNAYVFRGIRITRNDSITPKVGIKETWTDRTSYFNNEDIFITRGYTELKYRRKLGRYTNCDFTYSFWKRFKKNTLETDFDDNYYGVETNSLGMTFATLPTRDISLRMYTNYDFRRYSNEIVPDWLTKFTPLSTNFSLTHFKWKLYLGHKQEISPFRLESIRGEISYKVTEKNYVSLGLDHRLVRPNVVNFTNSFALWLSRKWHIEVSNRFSIDNENLDIQYSSIDIYRDLHCWEAKLSYEKQKTLRDGHVDYIDSYFLNLGLKVGRESRGGLFDIEHEKEFYPERESDSY